MFQPLPDDHAASCTGNVRYPQGAVSECTDLFDLIYPSPLGLFVNPPAERIGPPNGSSIAGKAFIAYLPAVLVNTALDIHTARLRLTGPGVAVSFFTLPAVYLMRCRRRYIDLSLTDICNLFKR
jgi:hypothetical protein